MATFSQAKQALAEIGMTLHKGMLATADNGSTIQFENCKQAVEWAHREYAERIGGFRYADNRINLKKDMQRRPLTSWAKWLH